MTGLDTTSGADDTPRPNGKLAVVALGGNVLIRDAGHQSIPDQYAIVEELAPHLIDLVASGWRLVVTHGNGPQAGFIMRRSELASPEVAPVPLDYVVGDTQGAMGYMFVKALANELHRRKLLMPVVAVVTQAVVDAGDPAFGHPTKPVGTFLDEATARHYADTLGWTIAEDSGRGWRRTVPSPIPVEVVELPTIAALIEQGTLVVAGGGGGIPVVRDPEGRLRGVEAVIDKDLTSARIADGIGADLLVLCTGEERVAVDFGTPQQRWLDRLSLTEARELADSGQLGEGSMKPKVEALIDFVRRRPDAAGVITTPDRLSGVPTRRTGTWISA